MLNMLTEILQYLKNWFVKTKYIGAVTISGGTLDETSSADLVTGQYFRIIGSALNDGVWQYPAELRDEEFNGAVWGLSIPQAVVMLAYEIDQWQQKNGESAASPFQSESFGGYSYSKASGVDGFEVSWKTAFGSRLSAWRKI